MKRIICIYTIMCICLSVSAQMQSGRISEALKELQMENIAVVQQQDAITAAFETSAYRGTYNGIGVAIRRLITLPEPTTLHLVILDNGLPQLCITLSAELIEEYQSGGCDLNMVYRLMHISTSTKAVMDNLKGVKHESTTFGKTDIVVYPGVLLTNNLLTKLYRAAFELQPAVEMQLWKGASLRLQVCLPIINNEQNKWDCIRPGYLTLRQDFRLDNHWKGFVTGGNFSNDREGVAAGIGYFSADGRWTLEGEGGFTGPSHLYGKNWYIGKWKRVNGMLSAGYYVPQLNTRLRVSGGRFLYGDHGVQCELSRYFGETIIGFYGIYTDGNKNAGFHFSIPLPGKKRNRHAVRVMLPETFAFQYDMWSGEEYAKRSLGASYRTEPKAAENSRFRQPDYIRYYLIRTNNSLNN